MTWVDVLGYAASAAVLATFCMSTMIPLRLLAIGSNVLFMSFGALAHVYPVLALHLLLLPINVMRLARIRRVERYGRRLFHAIRSSCLRRRIPGPFGRHQRTLVSGTALLR